MSVSPPRSAAPRPIRFLPLALFAGLVLVVYADPLFTRRNFGGRDLTAYNLAMEKGVHDAWSRGRLPVWQPEISGGRPLLPNPNAGALYPVRALLATVPFPVAVRIYPVLHWAAAGIGMAVLLLALGRSAAAAAIGAVTYAFSGVAVGEVLYPHIQPGMTLLPWIVWATQRRSGSGASRLLLLSFVFALDMLAADVFTIALAIACSALWIALEEKAEPGAALGRLGLGIVLAALAAAPQIVATALWIPLTNRAVLGMKLSEVILFSIHPWRLLELIVPFPFGPAFGTSVFEMWGTSVFRGKSMGIFPTLYAGAFAVIAVAVAWRSSERGARFARAVLLLTLVVSVVPSLLPAAWAAVSSPLPLRNPEKLAVAIVFALAMLAGLAFDGWRSRARRLGGAIGVGGVLAAAALACSAYPEAAGRLAISATRGDPGLASVAARHLPETLAEAGLLWMATVIALDLLGSPARRWRWACAVSILILVPILSNRRIARSYRQEEVFAPTAFARFVSRQDPDGASRTLDESLFRPMSALERAQYSGALSDLEFSRRTWHDQTPALFGRGTVFNSDFDSGDLSRVESLRKVSHIAAGFRDSEAFFGAMALRFGIRYRDQEALAGYRAVGGDALQSWDEHRRPFPDIRLLDHWLEVREPVSAFRSLAGLREGEVVIEGGAQREGVSGGGSVRVLERSAERLALTTESPSPTWLFVLRAFWPYRTILLDGNPVEAYPAQLAFCAVPIPPGRHRLTWEERMPGSRFSAWGPVLYGIIAFGLVAAHVRRRKR